MTQLKRLNVRLRPEMHEWLSKNAEVRGLSMNALVVVAIETYVQQQQVMPLLPEMMRQLKQMDEESDQ